MKKVLFLLFAFASVSFADDMSGKVMLASYSALAAGLVLGIAALGGAIGMGNAASAALSGIARNPGLSGALVKNMFIALAIIEAQVLYGFVVALILLYLNPLFAKIG